MLLKANDIVLDIGSQKKINTKMVENETKGISHEKKRKHLHTCVSIMW